MQNDYKLGKTMQDEIDRKLGLAKYNIQALRDSIRVVPVLGVAEKIYINEVIQVMIELTEYLATPKTDE